MLNSNILVSNHSDKVILNHNDKDKDKDYLKLIRDKNKNYLNNDD